MAAVDQTRQLTSILKNREYGVSYKIDALSEYFHMEGDGFDHLLHVQKQALAAIIRLYLTTCIEATGFPFPVDHLTDDKTCFITSFGAILAAQFGSGKTIIALAFIRWFLIHCKDRACRNYAAGLYSTKYVSKHNRLPLSKFPTEITSRNMSDKATINPVIVVVGSAVMSQWIEEIRKWHSDLKVFVLNNQAQFVHFRQHLADKTIDGFDIILVKQGTVAGAGVGAKGDEQQPLMNAVAAALGDRNVRLAIGDDIDMLNIVSAAELWNCMWFLGVSCSTNGIDSQYGINGGYTPTINPNDTSALLTKQIPIVSILTDHTLRSMFGIMIDPVYLQQSVSLPILKLFRSTVQGNIDRFAGIIANMEGDKREGEGIAAALNAGAFGAAAVAAGIESTSAADIFDQLAGVDKAKRELAKLRNAICVALFPQIQALMAAKRLGKHTEEDFKKIYSCIMEQDPPTMPNITFVSRPLLLKMQDISVEITNEINRCNMSIDIVTANVKRGGCQKCKRDISTQPFVTILRCCSTILCDPCLSSCGWKKGKHFQYPDHETTRGICITCPGQRYIWAMSPKEGTPSDLLCVGNTEHFNIKDLVSKKYDQVDAPAPEPEEAVERTEEEKSLDLRIAGIKDAKIQALVKTIFNIPIERIRYHQFMPEVMEGSYEQEWKEGDHNGTVVYSNYNEQLSAIAEVFKEFGITYDILQGNGTMMRAILDKFRAGEIQVLLINSQHYSSGINLQYARRLVFMHWIRNAARRHQVIGRIMRFGRDGPCAEVMHILYQNEIEAMLEAENRNDR